MSPRLSSFILCGIAAAQSPPAVLDVRPAAVGAGPPPAALGPYPAFPGAGTVLATQAMPLYPQPWPQWPTPDTNGGTYDRSRGLIWFVEQNRNLSSECPGLYAVTPTSPHTIVTSIICLSSSCVSAPSP